MTKKHSKNAPAIAHFYSQEFDDRTLATLAGQNDVDGNTNLDLRDKDGLPLALDKMIRGGSR